jgi:hypothetical protein
MDPIYEKVIGAYGEAEPIELPDIPQSAATVASWLITSENYHPFFHQWLLAGLRLGDIEGFPPAKRQFDGTTHEIFCVTLNPEAGRYDLSRLATHMTSGDLPTMDPPSIAVQVWATDDEITPVLSLMAQAVVHGALSPESMWTAGMDRGLNEQWLTVITKTLAHQRGETHAP